MTTDPKQPIDLSQFVVQPLEPDSFDYSYGAKAMGEITISGTWDGPWLPPPVVQRVVISEGFSLLGLSLWAQRTEFEAEMAWTETVDAEGLTTVGADMRTVSPVVIVRAEWWRRGLFHALRPAWRLYGWIADKMATQAQNA